MLSFQHLKSNWESDHLYRADIEEFTKGYISPRYVANLDAAGKGPTRHKSQGKIVYFVDDFIEWLEERSEVVKC